MKYKFKPSHIVPAFLFCVCVIYGGSKPPCSTNTPPDDAAASANGAPQNANQHESSESPRMMVSRFASIRTIGEDSRSASITNWTARGAYCDWKSITFSDGFRFPVGTNLIDAVTLFAYGEVGRVAPRPPEMESANSTPAARGLAPLPGHRFATLLRSGGYALPMRVSLEPNVSSVTHGLTPSNSYLFAWHNACIERSATNRVDASIELFASGAVRTIFEPLTNNQPPTTNDYPAILPPEIPGIGQDDDWIRATFPDEADNILAMGYESWLAAWVGENEMNGRYQAAVTVSALPEDGTPCYLFCGPYRVNVTATGTYRFPLEVLTTYETRTYPTAVPLTFEYDDGYTGEGQSFHVVDGQNPPHGQTPRMMMLAAPMHIPYDYWKTLCPDIVVTPDRLPLETASGSHLRFWCNVRDLTIAAIEGAAWLTWYEITHSEIALDRVDQAGWYYACAHERDWLLTGDFVIDPPSHTNEENTVTNRTDAWIFSGETIHTEIVQTNRLVTHVTAVSGANPTTSLSIRLAEGQSAYVAVYMASTEPDGTPPYDDTVSWSVTSNGGGGLSGSTSVFAQSEALAGAVSLVNRLYGVDYDPLFLAGQRFIAPSDVSLRLQISVSASDAVDDKRETCVQVVVYPIDENGNVIGLPTWVSE